jgi:hypothetical protein
MPLDIRYTIGYYIESHFLIFGLFNFLWENYILNPMGYNKLILIVLKVIN